ncbi:PorV/PorQ family protein, partial [Hoylesella shahii]
MKKVIFALVLVFMGGEMVAQESQTAYNFLRLPVSAHAAALGGDNVTLIDDDAWLMYNNPALLSSVSDKTVALNYMNFMRGVNLAGVAYNRVIKERASVALSANYVNYGQMRYTTADNQDLGEFSAKDIAVTAYFSYMLT